ncbi:MAG TPA: hypothetical protein VME63_16455 [Dyella sp.]|nr:hypothetical protein [Dyella sp.]
MWTALATMAAAYAGTAASFQSASQAGAPGSAPAPASAPATGSPAEHAGYLAQHFSADALNPDVKAVVMHANLAPVPFGRIVVRTREQVTSAQAGAQGSQAASSVYAAQITYENAGQGLVRRMEVMQTDKGDSATRLELSYRGYFPFLTQSISSNAQEAPPIVGARKVVRFDTQTDGHMNFTYFYGAPGQDMSADPGQVVCDAGKRYAASQLNAAIQGQALELDCQLIDENGGVTSKVTFAYLDKYQVALLLRVKYPDSTLDSTIEDFRVE